MEVRDNYSYPSVENFSEDSNKLEENLFRACLEKDFNLLQILTDKYRRYSKQIPQKIPMEVVDIDIIRFLLDRSFEVDHELVCKCISQDRLEKVKLFVEKGYKPSDYVIKFSILYNFEIFKFFVNKGFECDKYIFFKMVLQSYNEDNVAFLILKYPTITRYIDKYSCREFFEFFFDPSKEAIRTALDKVLSNEELERVLNLTPECYYRKFKNAQS